MKNILSLLVPLLFSSLVFAQVRPSKTEMKGHDATAAEMRAISKVTTLDTPTIAPAWTPVHDTADFKYVLLSTESY